VTYKPIRIPEEGDDVNFIYLSIYLCIYLCIYLSLLHSTPQELTCLSVTYLKQEIQKHMTTS
jgi:hypothetical protein